MHLSINPFKHRIQIAGDIRIPKSDDAVSFLLKPKLSLSIFLGVFIVVMMPAVELDNQMFGRTEEVHDIGTNGRLTPKVCATDRELFQSAPQYALMRRRIDA